MLGYFEFFYRAHGSDVNFDPEYPDDLDSQLRLRMRNAVHLEGLRCDGQAHGGCQAGCLLYWKEAWLRRVPSDGRERYESAWQTRQSVRPAAEAVAPPPSTGVLPRLSPGNTLRH